MARACQDETFCKVKQKFYKALSEPSWIFYLNPVLFWTKAAFMWTWSISKPAGQKRTPRLTAFKFFMNSFRHILWDPLGSSEQHEGKSAKLGNAKFFSHKQLNLSLFQIISKRALRMLAPDKAGKKSSELFSQSGNNNFNCFFTDKKRQSRK